VESRDRRPGGEAAPLFSTLYPDRNGTPDGLINTLWNQFIKT